MPDHDTIWRHRTPGPDALASALRQSRPWSGEPVPLPARVATSGWVLLAVLSGVTLVLTTAMRRHLVHGTLWDAATLGGHPQLTLVLCAASAATLALLMVTTCGLTRAGHRQQLALVVTAVVGVLTISGAVLVVIGGLFVVAAMVALLAAVLAAVLH